ncbi:hypothetical protein ACFQZ4_44240 [Catellatospora coxensis]
MPDQHDAGPGGVEHPHLGTQRLHRPAHRRVEPRACVVELQHGRRQVTAHRVEDALVESATDHGGRVGHPYDKPRRFLALVGEVLPLS